MGAATRDEIRFLLGREERRIRAVSPDMTVLDFLRLDERRRGTKEGCGEGDCGACSVVVGEAVGDGIQYSSVNACIQFLSTLDGKQLLSVEDLGAPDGAPHPCQQAMVESHGSQCGFCTPGFVMALFALYHQARHQSGRPDRNEIDDALAGNLCRCTGYGPIVAAARRMGEIAERDQFEAEAPETLARLKALDDGAMLALDDGERRFLAPRSVDQLAAVLRKYPNAVILAGGTDVGLWVTKQLRPLSEIIYLGEVKELKRLAIEGNWIEIGAAITYTEAMPFLAGYYPDLVEMMRRLGSTQIRNVGTIGGNIANGSPIGDCAPALIALGARLVLRGRARERAMALEDFFIEYGKQDRAKDEFVSRVLVPLPEADTLFRCYKITKRFDQDITSCLGAFRLKLKDGHVAQIRIAYGGMAGTPKRASALEAALLGQVWEAGALEAALPNLAQDFQPITDMRAGAEYRLKVAGNLARKFLIETTQPNEQTRIVEARRQAHARA